MANSRSLLRCRSLGRRGAFLVALVALLTAPTWDSALASEPQNFSGRFELADPAAAVASRDAAVEAAAAEFPRLFRKLARGKILEAATLPQFFELKHGKDSISISSDRSEGWTTDLRKTEVEVVSAQGKKAHLTRWMEGPSLHSRARGERGSREGLFKLSEDGQLLEVTTTILGDRVAKPLVFVATYRRTPSAPPAR